MSDAKTDSFLADQKYKCNHLLKKGMSLFDNADKNRLRKDHGIIKMNITTNEANGTETRRCQPFFDGLLCWSRTDAPGIATLPCPPLSSMGHPNLTSDNLRVPAVATKVCLANGEWYQDSNGIFWSNYSLCDPNSASYLIDDAENLNYLRWYDRPAEFSLLNQLLPIIKLVSQIGYATSFITLSIAMVIFSLLKKLRNPPRNRLHMHLFASFIMRAFMALLKHWIFMDGIGLAWDVVYVAKNAFIRERNTYICKFITSIWQYFIVANYAWILMEGLYLHNLVFLALCADTSTITLYILLGWGLPILIVVPWIITRATIEDTLCWITHDTPSLFLIIKISIMISILFNFLLFLNIVRVLLVKLKTSVHLQRKKMKYKRWAKSTMVLVLIFGIHYIFVFLSYQNNQVEVVWLFCDQLFTSFQGTFVALLYCMLNGEVRAEIQRAWKARRSKREVDSFISGHRESSKNSRDGINRKRHRSEDDDGANFTVTVMKKLSMNGVK